MFTAHLRKPGLLLVILLIVSMLCCIRTGLFIYSPLLDNLFPVLHPIGSGIELNTSLMLPVSNYFDYLASSLPSAKADYRLVIDITARTLALFAVYRGPEAQSPAHYRVAHDLARFLSTRLSIWVADAALALPASQASLERWAQKTGGAWSESDPGGWHNIEAAIAWTLATGIPAQPANHDQAERIRAYHEDVLAPALERLLDGELTPEAFVERITAVR